MENGMKKSYVKIKLDQLDQDETSPRSIVTVAINFMRENYSTISFDCVS